MGSLLRGRSWASIEPEALFAIHFFFPQLLPASILLLAVFALLFSFSR